LTEIQDSRRRGVVAVIVREGKFLVIRRSQFVRAPRMHCFPGGAIEASDADEAAAVRRELAEELHVEVQPLRRVWQSATPWNVELSWWLAELNPAAEPKPNALEVEAFYWLSADEIRALPELLASNAEFLDAWDSGEVALDISLP
jgi:8-oxo-dGTP pyrophosphatase MutT (NUDIX family)